MNQLIGELIFAYGFKSVHKSPELIYYCSGDADSAMQFAGLVWCALRVHCPLTFLADSDTTVLCLAPGKPSFTGCFLGSKCCMMLPSLIS